MMDLNLVKVTFPLLVLSLSKKYQQPYLESVVLGGFYVF